MHAKLINGQLKYSTNFEKIGDNWVSNPSDEQLIEAGFKELIYQEIDEVIEPYAENETQIVVFMQKYVESEITEIV